MCDHADNPYDILPSILNLRATIMGGERTQPTKATASVANYPMQAAGPVGKRISNIYKERITQFYSIGQWEKQNLLAMMYEGIASGHPHVKLSTWAAPGLSRPTFEEAMKGDFKSTNVGESFGPSWATHWFKIVIKVPSELCDKAHLEFQWDAGNEGMRVEWILPKSFRNGQEHTFYIEMACNHMFGNAPGGDSIQPPDPNKQFRLVKADICAVNMDARQLWIDTWIIGDAAREFPEDSWEQHKALNVATAILENYKLGDKESIKKCRKIAQDYIGANVDSAKVYDSGKEAQVFGIGHCHIDTCWLWPWAETKRKVARSWSNQCDLMERYPELNFACSQAQQYQWLEEYYPYVFDRVKHKVKEGKFHPIGGSWVEHDTNMPSGESLVRQFLYGQRYFESHFGERCKTFWLPDTFGYSSQLPQLCRLAGMHRFLTQKLSWNNINNFPTLPSTGWRWTAASQHKSMDQDHTSLLVFGKGDGGGGPTWQHIEKLRRCRGISDEVGLLPRVHLGNTVDQFFDKLQDKGTSLVTWYGELYFELHRGTYTTQANNKLNNRRSEVLMKDLELLATIASLQDKSYQYPKKDFDKMWEAILLCQFHDCLPGSSIEMCYDDSDELYAEVAKIGERIFKDICNLFKVSEMKPASVGDAVALSTLPWHRKEVVDISETQCGVACGSGPMLSIKNFKTDGEKAVTVEEVEKGVFVMQNEQLRVTVEKGCITSLFDRQAGREVVAKDGKANQFVIFDDKPLYWQAWDVEVYHLDSRQELACGPTKIYEDKEHRVGVITETKISENSSMKTVISLSAAFKGQQSFVDVTCDVDWHETMKFLKVEFPVDITNTEASYETQYGLVRRPTHYNTTWDMAKFEVCCHKFADLSENGYGVSILNDSKYGFATCGNLMRLSLLRAPKAPDAHADMGRHTIKWAILPHQGSLGATTVRAGHNFNNPLKVLSAPTSDSMKTMLSSHPVQLTGDSSLVLDCVKRGEDDEGVSRGELQKRKGQSVICRVYDSLGGQSRGTIKSTWDVKKVWKTNVLEDDEEELDLDKNGSFSIKLRPFEVATYRLQL
ncbi:alpha-mannosidase [Apiospora hydei]|uniref:alpha-mannosidase n=1 Tax=Apiospora hydei TaxID=1337664 RepID=A0ABR1X221_9PEZI